MEQTQFQAIVGFIRALRTIASGTLCTGKYRDVLLPMTVIWRLNAVLEKSKPEVLAMKAKLEAEKVTNQTLTLCQAAGHSL